MEGSLTINLPAWLPPAAIRFFAAGLAGMAGHYVSKSGRGEIKGSLYRYLFVDRPGYTLATVLSLVAATAASVAVGGIENMTLAAQVASGFAAGWALDSGVNKGATE